MHNLLNLLALVGLLTLGACSAGSSEGEQNNTAAADSTETEAQASKDENKAGLPTQSHFTLAPRLCDQVQLPYKIIGENRINPEGTPPGKRLSGKQYFTLYDSLVNTIIEDELFRVDEDDQLRALGWGQLEDGRYFVVISKRYKDEPQKLDFELQLYNARGQWQNAFFLARNEVFPCERQTLQTVTLRADGSVLREEKIFEEICAGGESTRDLTQHTRGEYSFPEAEYEDALQPIGQPEDLLN